MRTSHRRCQQWANICQTIGLADYEIFSDKQNFWQTLYREVYFTGNFMSDIQSGTNEKVAGPAKVLSGLSGRSYA